MTDDFKIATKRRLAHRAGFHCSRCDTLTTGPSSEAPDAVNNVGVAAHIRGARPGSCRHDHGMTSKERASIENGIWLCQNCAKAIDGDEAFWTIELLLATKREAESRARQRVGAQRVVRGAVLVEACECGFIKHYRAAFVPVRITNERNRAITIKEAWLRLDGRDYVPSNAHSCLSVGVPWLLPPPLRLRGLDAKAGAWFFGQSFPNSGCDVVAKPGDAAELVVVPVGGLEVRTSLRLHHPDEGHPGSTSAM